MGRSEESLKYFEENKDVSDDIERTVAKLKEDYKEDSGLSYGDPRIQKIERFTQWLKENGSKFSKIRIRYYGQDNRGVHACEYIRGKETLLTLPKKLIITPELGRNTQIGKLLSSKPNLTDLFYLTLFLLQQLHDPLSFWQPYVDVYPHSVSSFPMFYSEEEKLMLHGSVILEDAEEEMRRMREEYENVAAVAPGFKKFTVEEYVRNKVLIKSRALKMKIDGIECKAIVPLADMFNYHYEKLGQTSWKFDQASDCFVVNAERDISLGDSVFFSE
eukprot:TRINITY_DN7872_c0_g4_i1.p1 TRINITY_DN7872_c0_g4~~TRINITY_DN7872_c0_g4_i1.p1  ORF type:complete len:274 (+),score=96.76 TRINITY_DN7872_c0_g4_i1:430-1251(+)